MSSWAKRTLQTNESAAASEWAEATEQLSTCDPQQVTSGCLQGFGKETPAEGKDKQGSTDNTASGEQAKHRVHSSYFIC